MHFRQGPVLWHIQRPHHLHAGGFVLTGWYEQSIVDSGRNIHHWILNSWSKEAVVQLNDENTVSSKGTIV